MKEFYEKNCEFDIRIFKNKNMLCSRQVITGSNKVCILTGVASLLQSCLDAKLLTADELQEMANMVIEARKNGARNKVIYNNIEE